MEKSLQQMLEESKYTVVLSGFGMLLENGYPALRDGEESYEIEQKYGYSTEEIFHSSFFSTRKELFYDFYRNEMLEAMKIPPGDGFIALAELQKLGVIQSIITRRVYGLPGRAGCENVIELHGSVCENYCSHCGKRYPMEAIRDTKKVPLCTDCNMPIRPGVILYGEMVDNGLMTRAAEEVSRADLLLILGTNLKTYLCEQMTGYYKGNKMVLVTLNTHFSDKEADFVIHNRVDKTLENILIGLKAKQE